MAREGRAYVPPFAAHGFLGNTPANGVTPVQVYVVLPLERRRLPLDPIVLKGPAPASAPTVSPPPSLFVLLPDRRRLPLDPIVTRGVPDDLAPPPILVIPPLERRRLPLDPLIVKGAIDNTPPTVTPPLPVIVLVDNRRAYVVLPSFGEHGFVAGAAPPPVTLIVRTLMGVGL